MLKILNNTTERLNKRPYLYCYATGISPDGGLIYGFAHTPSPSNHKYIFIYSSQEPYTQKLEDVLRYRDVNITNEFLIKEIIATNYNGTVIIGTAQKLKNPCSHVHFRIVLPNDLNF